VTVRRYRFALVLLVVSAVTWAAAAEPAYAGTPTAVKATQQLATLLSNHQAFSEADQNSAPLGVVGARRPLTGERTALPVLGTTTAGGSRWLHVRLPGRPNGHAGWIRRGATVVSTTAWHIFVSTSRRRVIVYHYGHPVRTVKAIVGKPSTPTPRGQFFVEEAIQMRPTDVGAPFALALSARSYVLQDFAGGPGQIALHGLANVGGILGTAVSHGCVRLEDDMMDWLVIRIGPGVPVTITS
jgi:lipoprotein-anchoring transpeptidase ErfK/SrfK